MTLSLPLRRILIGFTVIAVFSAGIIVGQNKYGTPKSIVHVVTIKWNADATAEQRQKALDGVKDMAAKINGIKNVWLRATKVQPQDYHAAFVIEFADQAAADAYVDHPAHREWEKIYIPLRERSTSHQITN
jgi:hypothetical protein